MGKLLWDAQAHDEYIRARDAAVERRVDEREGTSVARDVDAALAALSAEERQLLTYLLLSDTRTCIGACSDPVLSALVARGMLIWPPGVRPVLADDLVTAFTVPPALWKALRARGGDLPPAGIEHARRLAEAKSHFGARITPIAAADAVDPQG